MEPGPCSLLPPPLTQTSLLGTPQGQLLLSLGTPQDGGQIAFDWPERCVCACECVRENVRVRERTLLIVPLYCLKASIQFPQICLYSHFLHYFKPSYFCVWKTTGTVFLGTRLSPLSQSFLFQPLNCAIFQQELPLLSVALTLSFCRESGRTGPFLIP